MTDCGSTFASQVRDVAMMCVGGVENSISDGCWDEPRTPTFEELVGMCWTDVVGECPREVRFLGNDAIAEIIADTVETFEYPFGEKVEACK